MNCTSALLAFVPCDVDVGAPIWAGEICRDGREEIRRKWRWTVKISGDGGGGLWRNPKMVQMSGETFLDGEGLV